MQSVERQLPQEDVPASVDTVEAFRLAMRGFASTVTLVTACDAAGKWHGMAATAFSSVSMEPATCLICVNRSASIHETLLKEQRFCVNLMHQQNREALLAYTKPEFRGRRFTEAGWRLGPNGAPYQTRAQANIFCNMLSVTSVGSHDIVLAEVSDVVNGGDVDPLVYYEGAYRRTLAV